MIRPSMVRLTSPLVVMGARSISSSNALFAKRKSPEAVEFDKLKDKLKKEKQVYKKLKEKFAKEKLKINDSKAKAKAKEAGVKAKAKNDKLIKEALKTPRKLSPFNMYVKLNKGPMAQVSDEWKDLTESEKASYQDRADEYNEEYSKTYAPKPKPPVFGFAAFVKKNFVGDGREVSEVLKELSGDWNALAVDEKAKFAKDEGEWSQYQKALQNWKQERVSLYNQKNGTNVHL